MEYLTKGIRLVRADCLELLASMEDDSVDLVATDPPYYRVKAENWDRQWATKEMFLDWLDKVLTECARVTRPTGAIYLFCGPYMAADVELLMRDHFRVLNHLVWRKPTGRHLGCNKESLTKFFPQTERIIFAESRKRRPFRFEPIRAHIEAACLKAGVTATDINLATGTKMAGHWLGRSQFSFPSERHYATIRRMAPSLSPYKELRGRYDDIRKGAKGSGRFMALTRHSQYTDVWDFPVVQPRPGKHPCEKPLALMEHIISASSRPGELVLDLFTGSGSTPMAAARLGRQFVGSELGEKEFAQAVDRLESCAK